ncbi:MAG: N-acetyltransferase [Bacteroidales bacterium]|nr:N-acetyltransferase [Bacteroidales bacterium]
MIEIRRIEGRKAWSKFVRFAIELYRGNPYYVPPIISMEVDTFDPAKNPAFQFCESAYFMAYRDGRAVGRIAGFVNRRANQKFATRVCRFCWADFIDDEEVSRALLDAVGEWGRGLGMDTIVGPLGPTDIDNEGCLVWGFDQLPTTANSYNAPYYRRHFESYGLTADATWFEYRMEVPDAVPEKHLRVAQVVQQRYGLRVFADTDAKHIASVWGHKLFHLMNEAYAQIYGFTELSEEQIDYYVNLYLPQVPLRLVRLVADADDNLIAFGISIPSLSRAQQKANGRLFPFGWYHLLSAMYRRGVSDTVDLLLMAVRPDYQGKGVNALLFTELIPEYIRWGFRYVETNAELTTNHAVQNQWTSFNAEHHKTRCTFKGAL